MAKVIECDQCGDKISGDYLEIDKISTFPFSAETIGVSSKWPKEFHMGCVAKWATEHYVYYTKNRFDSEKYEDHK